MTPEQRRSAAWIIVAKFAGNLADIFVNAKTVVTWLAAAVGAPGFIIAALVPLRESGSMLPQLWLTRLVTRVRVRKHIAMIGAVGQAVGCAVMAGTPWLLDGLAAGVGILLGLALLAGMRALSSIASKDVLGRVVPKGARGRITGLGTSLAGAAGAIASIATMFFFGAGRNAASTPDAGSAGMSNVSPTALMAVVGLGGVLFLGSALAFVFVRERATPNASADADDKAEAKADANAEASTPRSEAHGANPGLSFIWKEAVLRRFVIVRGLLLGSALGAPYIVLLGRSRQDELSLLAAFVLAGGAASASSSWAWGRMADRSGSRTMATGGLVAGFCGGAALLVSHLSLPAGADGWVWPGVYFVFSIGYAGVRVGRKVYVVDIAKGDQRTRYVAASNTAIAIALLVFGALVGAVHSAWGSSHALGLLSTLTLLGAIAALALPTPSDSTSTSSGRSEG